MILPPIPSPTGQPVGCVRVEEAIQVCGVRLMPARQVSWGRPCSECTLSLCSLPCRHLDLRFVDAHALGRLHTMLLEFVGDLSFC